VNCHRERPHFKEVRSKGSRSEGALEAKQSHFSIRDYFVALLLTMTPCFYDERQEGA